MTNHQFYRLASHGFSKHKCHIATAFKNDTLDTTILCCRIGARLVTQVGIKARYKTRPFVAFFGTAKSDDIGGLRSVFLIFGNF